MGFRVLGSRVWGLGFRVLGPRVEHRLDERWEKLADCAAQDDSVTWIGAISSRLTMAFMGLRIESLRFWSLVRV